MGMPDVEDEIFEYSNDYITSKSIYSPKVLPNPPIETKVFPLVSIKQLDTVFNDENLDKSDQVFRLEFEIEIYAIDKGSIAKEEIIKELKTLVNDIFDKHYGMALRTCNPTPNADRNVNRLYMRYNALIDENKTIFRR